MSEAVIELWIDCRFCRFSPCCCAEIETLMRAGITPEMYARLWEQPAPSDELEGIF